MQIVLSTGSLWTYSIERCFAFAAAAGFDGVEIMVDQRYESRQANFLRDLVQQHGLPIIAVHSPFRQPPGWPADQPELIQMAVQLAEAVGAHIVVHHLPDALGRLWVNMPTRSLGLPIPGWRPHRRYRQWLETAYAALQAQTAVCLCIENMPAIHLFGRPWQTNHWNTPAAMQRFPHITLDTTHLGTWGLDPADVYPQFRGRIGHVHLSNYDGREHRHPENGRLQLARFLALLAADQYEGAVSLEIYPDQVDAGQADVQVIDRLRGCAQWIRQHVRTPQPMTG